MMMDSYVIKNDLCSAEISSFGAELRSLKSGGREYLWQGDPTVWEQRSPLLFPFVGRLTDGKYRIRSREYPLTIHGFASNSQFIAERHAENELTLTLCDSKETRKIYPFRFALRVHYVFKEQTLCVDYEVENRSGETMFFGIGGHPGFRVPLEDGLSFEDYMLDFDPAHLPVRVGHTEACFLNGQDKAFPLVQGHILPLAHDLFEQDAIVLKDVARKVTLRSDRSPYSVTMSYPDMPYLGIWHRPHTEAPYVCIEPWTSLPSRQDVIEDFSVKSDLLHLAPGGVCRRGWTVTLQ